MRLPRLPDLLTTANLSCGVASILLASQGQLTSACWLVFAGAVFDVFDGLAARALGGGSALGKQLDSLADMVTFGVAPGILSLRLVGFPVSMVLLQEGVRMETATMVGYATVLIIPIASAWRLARFNIDDRQHSGFIGLPTPANALFWASLTLGAASYSATLPRVWALLLDVRTAGALMVALSALMLSSIPLPSLKFKHFRWRGNEVIYLLIGAGAVLVALYGVLAVPLVLFLYLLSPLWGRIFAKTT
jgi:CDP-diacylglycerol--serine O-phosphatidyltransferase